MREPRIRRKVPVGAASQVWRLARRKWTAENRLKVDQAKNGWKLRRITFLCSALQDVQFG